MARRTPPDGQLALIGEPTLCTICGGEIDAARNHQPDPPAHVGCAWRRRMQAAPGPTVDAPEARRMRHWIGALTNRYRGAITGSGRGWEPSAEAAETPRRFPWDILRPDGSVHLPAAAEWSRPCPGGPWTAEPEEGAVRCRRKHWHTNPTDELES